MATELFDLCKEVYEKTGWKMPKSSRNRFYTVKGSLVKTWNDRDDSWTFPLYTSDYLLEKLKDLYVEVNTRGFAIFADSEKTIQGESDTPLKALLKLTLALHAEGELK